MRKRIAIGAMVFLMLAAAAGCGKKDAPVQAEVRPQTVSAVRVEKTDLTGKLTLSGKISPAEEVRVAPKAPGKVARISGEVGQAVAAGFVLLELENSDIQARLEAARAALAVSEANLERTRIQLEKTRIQMDDARRSLERRKTLFDSGAASRADYEAAMSSFESAKKDFEMNEAGLAASRAAVEQSRAAVRQIEVDLENSFVRSPIGGIIAGKNAVAGEYVTSGTASMVVVNIDIVEVALNLLEDEINFLKQGQEVEVAVPAVAQKGFKGKVARIGPAADAKTKAYPVWVAVGNGDKLLKPGMFAEVRMETRKREGVLAVPAEAVVERGGQKVVYLVQEGKAVECGVKTGVAEGGRVEITEGLAGGEMVIVTGVSSLRNGQPVNPAGGPGGPQQTSAPPGATPSKR